LEPSHSPKRDEKCLAGIGDEEFMCMSGAPPSTRGVKPDDVLDDVLYMYGVSPVELC
jgi:hypothetical protein